MQLYQHKDITIRRSTIQKLKDTPDARELNLRLWQHMQYMRNWECALKEHYQPPHLTRCPIHYAIGQELLPAVIQEVKREGDYLFCHHRNHNFWLAWTERPDMLLAELMGKEDAPNKGRAGSQEISLPAMRFHSGAILSTMIGVAVGTAWSIKLNGGDERVYCAFGDGAADEGIFWEAMNFIALKNLPITLLCENNGYATFSPQGKRQAKGISGRVNAFGVDGFCGNGVHGAGMGTEIIEGLGDYRKDSRPCFVEHFTYRHCGHVGVREGPNQGCVDERIEEPDDDGTRGQRRHERRFRGADLEDDVKTAVEDCPAEAITIE